MYVVELQALDRLVHVQGVKVAGDEVAGGVSILWLDIQKRKFRVRYDDYIKELKYIE